MQVSLPMLAPLLLGTGMMFRSIKANASIIFPRIGFMVVLLWVRRRVLIVHGSGSSARSIAWVGFRMVSGACASVYSTRLMRSQLLQVLWFANSVVQNTVMYLRRQGAIDHRWACHLLAVACRLAISTDSGAQCICLVAMGRQLLP